MAGCQRLDVGTANQLFSAFPGNGHEAPQAEPSLFDRTLDARLSGAETLHSGCR